VTVKEIRQKGYIEESWVFQKERAIAWLVIAKTTMSQQGTLVSEKIVNIRKTVNFWTRELQIRKLK